MFLTFDALADALPAAPTEYEWFVGIETSIFDKSLLTNVIYLTLIRKGTKEELLKEFNITGIRNYPEYKNFGEESIFVQWNCNRIGSPSLIGSQVLKVYDAALRIIHKDFRYLRVQVDLDGQILKARSIRVVKIALPLKHQLTTDMPSLSEFPGLKWKVSVEKMPAPDTYRVFSVLSDEDGKEVRSTDVSVSSSYIAYGTAKDVREKVLKDLTKWAEDRLEVLRKKTPPLDQELLDLTGEYR